jgi:AcrR family transcriptional regulator
MTQDSNTVNIDKKPYHHGDLRAALIEQGMALLAQRDADSLSLREVARAAGVSATSVYRHFPDKEALFTALAMEGLAQLGAAQKAAGQAAGGGKQAFAATGRAYVRFALANPALFRLIFASPRWKRPRRAAGWIPRPLCCSRPMPLLRPPRMAVKPGCGHFRPGRWCMGWPC